MRNRQAEYLGGTFNASQVSAQRRRIVAAGDRLQRSVYDGLLLDLNLGGEDGFELLRSAVAAAEDKGASFKVGQVFTSDQFYNAQKDANQRFHDMGMLAVEMEVAGLYWTAMACHKKALGILTISDHIFSGAVLTPEERQDSFHEMMEIALETAWNAAE